MRRSTPRRSVSSRHDMRGYAVRVSDGPDDRDWDDSLENASHGSYTQSSCWGRARESIGWRPVRVIVSRDGHIVAGAQMETRDALAGMRVGFVFAGPVVRRDEAGLTGLVIDETVSLCNALGVRYLAIQPPRGDEPLLRELERRGFRRGVLDHLHIYHPGRVVIDLLPDLDEILVRASRRTRSHIRSTERGGSEIDMRRGTVDDLPIFVALRDAHSARLGYARRPDAYYEALWHAMEPGGHLSIFVAERQGEPVCAQLVVTFGDACHLLEAAWSGEHGRLRPNDLLDWHVMKWAKQQGYRSADLGGVEQPVMDAVAAGGIQAVDPKYGASLYKLKWGGRILPDPPFVDHVPNPALRFAYRCMSRDAGSAKWLERWAKGLKETRG